MEDIKKILPKLNKWYENKFLLDESNEKLINFLNNSSKLYIETTQVVGSFVLNFPKNFMKYKCGFILDYTYLLSELCFVSNLMNELETNYNKRGYFDRKNQILLISTNDFILLPNSYTILDKFVVLEKIIKNTKEGKLNTDLNNLRKLSFWKKHKNKLQFSIFKIIVGIRNLMVHYPTANIFLNAGLAENEEEEYWIKILYNLEKEEKNNLLDNPFNCLTKIIFLLAAKLILNKILEYK
ncbi:hypothetical protein [Spiroplasma chrysopicola]|uniref:Uncharacterized protein n=1 Tax=Spiroplasma chrysopicola DF-1 TaxID=1276227 RepID=R4UJK4_9MOLU|nr:hypothetical protein [Spiroplasma chrysopicola]AGM25491.1 hypothetical protein SCHRY_v1c09180 [Spiroplasma chrysopicola DF-1]